MENVTNVENTMPSLSVRCVLHVKEKKEPEKFVEIAKFQE